MTDKQHNEAETPQPAQELIAVIEPSFFAYRESLPIGQRDLFDQMFGKYSLQLAKMTRISDSDAMRRVIAMMDGGCMSIVRVGSQVKLYCDMVRFRQLRRHAALLG